MATCSQRSASGPRRCSPPSATFWEFSNWILAFLKIESEHLELESVGFSLADAVEEALPMVAQLEEAKALELAMQLNLTMRRKP